MHDDFTDQTRRKIYRDLVADEPLTAGYATEDGVGLHYVDAVLAEAVSIRPSARARRVESDGRGGVREESVPTRLI